MRSRIKAHIKQQNRKSIFLIIILLILVVTFGMKFIVGFSVLLEKLKNPRDESVVAQGVDYIAPPVLNPLPSATKEEKISVSGYSSSSNVSINLYVNGELIDKTESRSDKNFTFENVPLDSGENEIKARIESDKSKKSGFSQSVKIAYLNKPPSLEISSPNNDQTFKKDESPIEVSGKTDKGVKVTVNDFWTISNDDGTFYYMHNLKDGDNILKIVATDEAGNKTEKEIKIKAE